MVWPAKSEYNISRIINAVNKSVGERALTESSHQNPVRRGLCHTAEDWPWSSAADYAAVRVGLLRSDMETVPTRDYT